MHSADCTMKKPRTEIILVKYNNFAYEYETVMSVLECTEEPYNLTIYDNYENDENLSTIWNRLIGRSDAEYICLLNTDVNVQKGWLSKLLAVFDREAHTGAVGPVTNSCGVKLHLVDPTADYKVFDVTDLSAFCIVFPRHLWLGVGGFNEEYHLYGEDSEFVARIIDAGYKLKIRSDVFIYHYGGKSMEVAKERGKDIDKIRQKSKSTYKKFYESRNNN